MTRTLKFASERSAAVQLRPQVFAAPPSMRVAVVVPSVAVDCAAVQDTPPSHESWTHIFGEPDVLSARASRRTSMPCTVAPAGNVIP